MPPSVAALPWEPREEDRMAAWKYLVELRSRITTQALPFRAGTEDAALQSIYGMFEVFRKVAKDHPGATHFAFLVLRLLNADVRPFTSRWHPLREQGRLKSADFRIQFRTQLSEVQNSLRKGAELLAALADSQALSYPDAKRPADQSNAITDSLPLSQVGEHSDWKAVFDAELVDVRKKRAIVLNDDREVVMDGVGLAISGGGIRSATFSLGVVTVLARNQILQQVDYLSTVSGGGYLGAFLSSALGHCNNASHIDELFGAVDQPESAGLRALRNHSKYLIEGGIRTIATIAGMATYGLVTTLLLVLPAILLLAAAIRWIPAELSLRLFAILAATALAGYAVTAMGQRFRHPRIESFGIRLGLAGLASMILAFAWFCNFESLTVWIRVVSWIAMSTGVAICAIFVPRLAGVTRQLLGILVAALLLALAWLIVTALASLKIPMLETAWPLVYAALIVVGFTSLFTDINAASPQRFYRDRLARTYLIDTQGKPICGGSEKLSMLNPSHRAPYHLLNATLNIPGTDRADIRGRRSDFFLLSKYYCGGQTTGVIPTAKWEEGDGHLDLATAMAISGAAAAPNMGTNKASRFRYLFAMLNLRLSYWLKRPDKRAWLRLNPTLYFWHELRGNMSEKLPYLNLSDGGHIENLGIYELLRRRCKFIIAIDGEADPNRSFGGLLTLVQLARIDFGIDIDPDLSDLRADDQGIGQSHFELFRIRYPGGGQGVLVYIKASMTGNESEFLKRYRQEHPDFPHESTAKQLYSERQFEAYRSLGEHIAEELFRKHLIGDWKQGAVKDWVLRLSAHLLPTEPAH